MKRFLLFYLAAVLFGKQAYARDEKIYFEKTIVVVTASYNNKDWYEKNLLSIFSQRYFNYHVLYVDDCSTDGTADLVEEWVKVHGVSDRITIIRNKQRRGGLANHHRVINLIPDRAIVCVVDGDDWLSRNIVFDFLNETYQYNHIWLTYGQFVSWPDEIKGWCCEIPKEYVARNAFREHTHNLSHLRTFYSGLFKQIKKEDLMNGGHFWGINDNAVMFPMAEMARGHIKFIPQVLLVWNTANNINDHKVSRDIQLEDDQRIRSLPRYDTIETPFRDDLKGTVEELKRNIKKAFSEGII